MNYTTQQVLGYYVSLYQKSIAHRKPLVINDFFKQFLTRFELLEIVKWKLIDKDLDSLNLVESSKDELWAFIVDDYTILCYYLAQWEASLKERESITIDNVYQILSQLHLETHYLRTKSIEEWDAYDHSNYRSLQIKAGKLQRVYGIYDRDVKHEDIDKVTKPPLRYFESYAQASLALKELVKYQQYDKENLHILYLYKAI